MDEGPAIFLLLVVAAILIGIGFLSGAAFEIERFEKLGCVIEEKLKQQP